MLYRADNPHFAAHEFGIWASIVENVSGKKLPPQPSESHHCHQPKRRIETRKHRPHAHCEFRSIALTCWNPLSYSERYLFLVLLDGDAGLFPQCWHCCTPYNTSAWHFPEKKCKKMRYAMIKPSWNLGDGHRTTTKLYEQRSVLNAAALGLTADTNGASEGVRWFFCECSYAEFVKGSRSQHAHMLRPQWDQIYISIRPYFWPVVFIS